MSFFAVMPALVRPRCFRFWGALALVLSVALILGDIESGKRYKETFQRIRSAASQTNGSP
jgi:hypothetical protein